MATTFKVAVMARKDLESMCWAGLLLLPTIKRKEELNQHPRTMLSPGPSPGQLDVIRGIRTARGQLSQREPKAIVSIYTDNESL